MLALFEAWLYGAAWSLLSGPRIGQRLSATRFGRWIERKAGDSPDRRPSCDA